MDYVRTRLNPQGGEWVDRGITDKLLTREENQRRVRTLMVQTLQSGPMRISKAFRSQRDQRDFGELTDQPSPTQRSHEEIERQKKAIRDVGEDFDVPF